MQEIHAPSLLVAAVGCPADRYLLLRRNSYVARHVNNIHAAGLIRSKHGRTSIGYEEIRCSAPVQRRYGQRASCRIADRHFVRWAVVIANAAVVDEIVVTSGWIQSRTLGAIQGIRRCCQSIASDGDSGQRYDKGWHYGVVTGVRRDGHLRRQHPGNHGGERHSDGTTGSRYQERLVCMRIGIRTIVRLVEVAERVSGKLCGDVDAICLSCSSPSKSVSPLDLHSRYRNRDSLRIHSGRSGPEAPPA